jgi:hypothetical protein
MRHTLHLAAAAAVGPMLALASPAHAGLQFFLEVTPGSPASIDCPGAGSPSPCDYNGAGTSMTLNPAPFTLNGVIKSGELITATGVPGAPGVDSLSSSSLAVINTTNTMKTVKVVISDTNYTAPVSNVEMSGSGTFQATIGSTLTFEWFADPLDTQGADPTGNTPGTLLHTFNVTATGQVQSFSTNFTTAFSALAPFSMTEEAIYTVRPFGELLSRGTNMVAETVPEPSSWVMMVLGFAGLGFAGYHRSSRTKIAVID